MFFDPSKFDHDLIRKEKEKENEALSDRIDPFQRPLLRG
jgi:hypothetical protein